jgi:inner membrane protein
MRWLMPIDRRWWYGDTLFIIDPWIWLALGCGVWMARRRAKRGSARASAPARVALVGVGAYIAAMGALAAASRAGVQGALSDRGITADTVVVEPVPANPFSRRVIYHWNGSYALATYDVLSRALSEPWLSIPLNSNHPAVARASATPAGREYHSWTRLPYYLVEPAADTTWVTMADARYTLDGRSSWATMRVPVIEVR